MSMYTALSGINAAQSEIAATSHNIANAGTAGFKKSRVEFADIFSASPLAINRTAIGAGVQMARTAQIFSQGNMMVTGNVLDLAIEGNGFFAVESSVGLVRETRYTRSGAFSMNSSGQVVNSAGASLLAWPVSADGSPLATALGDANPLRIPPTMGLPRASSNVFLDLNFPTDNSSLGSQDQIPPSKTFDQSDESTYAFSSPVAMVDESGNALNATIYFAKVANGNLNSATQWNVNLVVDNEVVPPTTLNVIDFTSAGRVSTSQSTLQFDLGGRSIDLHFDGSVMTNSAFRVLGARHDGGTAASLSTLEVDQNGTIWAGYSSGEALAMGKLFLATFPNAQGLKQMGATHLAATQSSGAPILGTPGEPGYGMLRAGALERSNVDLTAELVDLITGQRNYQASAKAMETAASLSQTIMNLRT